MLHNLRTVETQCGPDRTHLGPRPVGLPSLDERLSLWLCVFSCMKMPYPLSSLFLSGLLESSTRLKPHEAQNYRKKALWVSWFSIIVTLALAVAAFSEYQGVLPINTRPLSVFPSNPCGICFAFSWLLLMSKNFFRWLDGQGTYELVKRIHSSAEGRGMRKERREITERFSLISMQVCGSGFWLAPAE